jgi:putative glutamine amidotransferase
MSRPIIGITLDSEPPGGYSKFPWYALRENYFGAVAAAGGLPVALPHEPEMAEAYLDEIDGLVCTGGAFDVDPALYGGGAKHPTAARPSSSRSPRARSRAICRCSAFAAASNCCTWCSAAR